MAPATTALLERPRRRASVRRVVEGLAAMALLAGGQSAGCFRGSHCDEECRARTRAEMECRGGDAGSCERLGWYELACEHGSAFGCMASARKLDPREHRIDANVAEAVRSYRLACDRGLLLGCVRGGTLLLMDPALAPGAGRALLERACNESAVVDCTARERVRLRQLGAPPTRENEEGARRECTEIRAGACREVSLALADGIDGPPDEPRAHELMEVACDLEDAAACAFLGYYQYAGIGAPRDEQAALALFDASCKSGAYDACSAAHVLRDEAPAGVVRVLARLLDEEHHEFSHRAERIEPYGLPPPSEPVEALSFIHMSGTVSFRGGRMTAVQGRLVSATPTRMTLSERRYQNILRMGYTEGSLMLLEWAAPKPSLEDDDCVGTDACKERGMCRAVDGYCRPSEEGCRGAESCRSNGLCRLADGRCVARDDDCRRSTACTDGGRCRADRGSCVR